jgi:curved DNA-binding protein CbpA
MSEWVDYYTVLGVPQGADADEIKRVYRFKSQTYHPDKVHPSHRDLAEREFIAFTAAYETLIDPDKRKIYDLEWEQRTGNRSASQGLPPKPEITPRSIRFADANAGEPGTASFVVDNGGGTYSHISISNPDSWLRVTGVIGLSQTDELPLQVDLEAVGSECRKTYTETIVVKLDEVAVPVNIELHTLAKQSRIKKAISSASPRYQRIFAFPREWRGQLTGAGASTLAGGLLILYCALGGFVGFQAIIIVLALSLIGLSVSSTVMTDWLRNKTEASGTLKFAANTSVVCGWLSIGATAVYAAVYAVILIFWAAVWLIAIAAVIGIICAMFSGS